MIRAPEGWEPAGKSAKDGWELAKWPEKPRGQKDDNLCYAAVAAAIGFQRRWTQEELVRRLAPYPDHTLDDHPDSLTQPRQLGVALDVIGATRARAPFTKDAFSAALDNLGNKLAVAIRLPTTLGHVVAIHGYHKGAARVLVWDPAGERTGEFSVEGVLAWRPDWLYVNDTDLVKL